MIIIYNIEYNDDNNENDYHDILELFRIMKYGRAGSVKPKCHPAHQFLIAT